MENSLGSFKNPLTVLSIGIVVFLLDLVGVHITKIGVGGVELKEKTEILELNEEIFYDQQSELNYLKSQVKFFHKKLKTIQPDSTIEVETFDKATELLLAQQNVNGEVVKVSGKVNQLLNKSPDLKGFMFVGNVIDTIETVKVLSRAQLITNEGESVKNLKEIITGSTFIVEGNNVLRKDFNQFTKGNAYYNSSSRVGILLAKSKITILDEPRKIVVNGKWQIWAEVEKISG